MDLSSLLVVSSPSRLSNLTCEKTGLICLLIDPGIWYIGGGTAQCRYFSRFIALQVKAALEGKPLSVYRDTPQVSSPTAVPVPMMAQVEIVLPKGVEVDEASRDMVDPQPQMIIV